MAPGVLVDSPPSPVATTEPVSAAGVFSGTNIKGVNNTTSISTSTTATTTTTTKEGHNEQQQPRQRLPVTLLSGFLGSGKTTLLEHILTSRDHQLRVGVIVNDVGALNIDAALLASHDVTRKQEQVVAMQNGCICCTLRGDLLEEVARLADAGDVEYLVIESSGVSEPMQVAETFSEEFAEMHIAAGHDLESENKDDGTGTDANANAESNKRLAEILKAGGLSRVARLDTCVTMVDAVNFMSDFHTADFLADREANRADLPDEDDRNISDLQVDQVEFADVIVVNKCDLVPAAEANRIRGVVSKLNPGAKILTTAKARLDVREILDTKLFGYEKAALAAGWLKSLTEGEDLSPETEEYGIGTFVYRARRPFHPARLWEIIKDVFVVIQEELVPQGGEEMDEEDDNDSDENEDEEMEDDDEEEEQPQLNPKKRLEAKMAHETFGPLLRSKGFLWLATRSRMFGEWSQAGVMLTISAGDAWRCEMPEADLPRDPLARAAILRDFEGRWGDRRQELVFIGQKMRGEGEDGGGGGGRQKIQEAMDACLLDDEEFRAWEEVMEEGGGDVEGKLADLFEDGFEDWVEVDAHAHAHAHAGHDHHGHTH